MSNDIINNTFDDGILIEAEISASWSLLLNYDNPKIFTLTQSIIYKLEQSHYHLLQALHYSELSKSCLSNPFKNSDMHYFNFITNCNIDAMMYALNSLMDIIKEFIVEIYSECGLKPDKPIRYFSHLKNNGYLESIKTIAPSTADIICSFFELPERKYVNEYCNENKHQRAYFSAGSYFYVNMGDDVKPNEDELGMIKGYTLKKRFSNSKDDIELNEYAPRLDKVHREIICALGESILHFKNIDPPVVDENFIKYVDMVSNRYFR